ncbi:DNA cytosine methyltransferase [Ammoniphilus resinae]|uniref:DNA (cytosine-5-)-methyltransferase n=1 Tax=Ammoniphilus resinae TaxID=861532 RepID=A0ABS4GNB1_9BACL|nr:DNA cytosine methyltransferase [Ammoniphilus resinae]MBP1931760.1 DNA (cytosine-5)-methyltransferase 1 [Ammoniphilus resinae]
MLKKRPAKVSHRGIYLKDKELVDTDFKIGSHFKYIWDVKEKRLVIVPTEEKTRNTVSHLADGVTPVIDIRTKEAREAFQGCDLLEVEIYQNQIVVIGSVKSSDFAEGASLTSLLSSKQKKGQLIELTSYLKAKPKAVAILSQEELKQAVGGYPTHITIEEESTTSSNSLFDLLSWLKIPLAAASIFSGAGLMDIGFIQAKFDVIFALEMDPQAVKTYRHNIGDHIVEANICDYMKSLIPKVPLLFGGSPCKGFSNANRHSNFLDNPNNLLVREYIDTVQTVQPLVFCLENVPQLLSCGGGKFKKEIEHALSDYEITSGVVSATSVGGAPQVRDRAIFIGSKIGRISLPEPTLKSEEYPTVRDAFEGLHDGIANQKDISVSSSLTKERIHAVPPGGNVHDIPTEIRPKGVHSNQYKRLKWDEPSVTVVNPRKAMLLHPSEDRILSVRECARLQQVPDDFEFLGTLDALQQQVANAVPVGLAYRVAMKIKEAFLQFGLRNRPATAW